MIAYLIDDSTLEATQVRQLLDKQNIPYQVISEPEAEEPIFVFEGRRHSGLAAIKALVHRIEQQKEKSMVP